MDNTSGNGINAAACIGFCQSSPMSRDPISSQHLVAGLQRLDRGFGFDPSFENCVACKRDVWRVGVRQPVNDLARLGQRIQDNVKGRPCFRGLANAGIVQNQQETEVDQTSIHGSFPASIKFELCVPPDTGG
jgi:hypothetical protein